MGRPKGSRNKHRLDAGTHLSAQAIGNLIESAKDSSTSEGPPAKRAKVAHSLVPINPVSNLRKLPSAAQTAKASSPKGKKTATGRAASELPVNRVVKKLQKISKDKIAKSSTFKKFSEKATTSSIRNEATTTARAKRAASPDLMGKSPAEVDDQPRNSARLRGKVPNYAVLAGVRSRAESAGFDEDDADAEFAVDDADKGRCRASTPLSTATEYTSPSVFSRDKNPLRESVGATPDQVEEPKPDSKDPEPAMEQPVDKEPANVDPVNAFDDANLSATETDASQDVADFKRGILEAIEKFPRGEHAVKKGIYMFLESERTRHSKHQVPDFPDPGIHIRGTGSQTDFGDIAYPFPPERLEDLLEYGREQFTDRRGPYWKTAGHDPTHIFLAEQVDIRNSEWDALVQRQAADAANKHGFSGNVVAAEFYSLAVWSKGSLFRSLHVFGGAKNGNHLATMVIFLRSPHTGGEVMIHGPTSSYKFETSGEDYISALVPTTCDPSALTSGTRVGLVYHIFAKPEDVAQTRVAESFRYSFWKSSQLAHEHLAAHLRTWFRAEDEGDAPQSFLLFALNESYENLSLSRFNPIDGSRMRHLLPLDRHTVVKDLGANGVLGMFLAGVSRKGRRKGGKSGAGAKYFLTKVKSMDGNTDVKELRGIEVEDDHILNLEAFHELDRESENRNWGELSCLLLMIGEANE